MVGEDQDAEASRPLNRRRHVARDAGLAVAGIAAGVALTLVPGWFDDRGSDGGPLPTTQAASVAAVAPAGGDPPVVDVAGADSAVAAVDAFLGAEQRGDLAASFDLLSSEDRRSIPSVAEWLEVHAEALAPVVGFQLGEPRPGDGGVVVPAVVEFEPGLDEISGLTPGRSSVDWLAVEDELGWRVSLAQSTAEPIYPTDAGVQPAAQAWLEGGGACDAKAAAGPGVSFLGLRRYLVDRLCRSDGPFVVGPPVTVDDPAITTDLVAAFGSAALEWARVVPVDGAEPVRLVLAPIGDRWTVIDVAER